MMPSEGYEVLFRHNIFPSARQLVRRDGGRAAPFTWHGHFKLLRLAHQLASAHIFSQILPGATMGL